MSQRLPSLPNLDHLKKQAKDVLRVARHRRPQWRLADAQHALARGYGFSTWPDLKVHVNSMNPEPSAAVSPVHPLTDDRSARSSWHPMAGTWVARPGTASRDSNRPTDVVVEIHFAEGALLLTQVAADQTGRDLATKMAIQADGRDHPIPFGSDLTLQAIWTDERTLDTVLRHGENIVARGTYEVSLDGRSLVVSTPEQRIVFERV